ncbi:MAG: RNA polymerase factor sigma-54 [Lentimicrobiaceae bacterium]|jgi:RNA polymerase sigma-54 factor|nr:RNA polymerase factor sigma-54 [Lentimicrobiaceae bacterium]MDD4596713.1 RNA polymerase factor sigma-54 [Lentimicrobiaceae bacterium]MDY0024946.1 RNA polymerase factor sigma-54 [Lentimicrobium sp.]
MLTQKLQQKLLQKLSPQQILLMKLLQIPSIALEQRIKQEIEENPALEDSSDPGMSADEGDTVPEPEPDPVEELEKEREDFDITEYLDDDDIPAYRLNANNTSADDEQREVPFASGVSFHEVLLQQLGLRRLDERQMQIARYIIGNLDDSGYLNRALSAMVDDLAFTQNIITDVKELDELLSVVQEFDPPGVGARDLRECLMIQLRRFEQTPSVALALQLVDKYFDELTKKHYDKITRRAKVSEDDLRDAVNEILKLNPKPGNSMGETTRANHYIMPDFFVYNKDGELELQINSRNAPELRLSRTYVDMLETYAESKTKSNSQKDAVMFIKQKIDSARWFIDAIKQRQNTLFVTMSAIMEYQSEYFLTGDETKLRPMILKDIAEIVGLDISTISRVANSKYVQTPFGTFLLKTFFSESMQTDSGEEVSTREIKKILSDCIDNEDKIKPLTDEQLTDILKEKGYNIARRTVAKYREQLSIPVARLRKEL